MLFSLIFLELELFCQGSTIILILLYIRIFHNYYHDDFIIKFFITMTETTTKWPNNKIQSTSRTILKRSFGYYIILLGRYFARDFILYVSNERRNTNISNCLIK